MLPLWVLGLGVFPFGVLGLGVFPLGVLRLGVFPLGVLVLGVFPPVVPLIQVDGASAMFGFAQSPTHAHFKPSAQFPINPPIEDPHVCPSCRSS